MGGILADNYREFPPGGTLPALRYSVVSKSNAPQRRSSLAADASSVGLIDASYVMDAASQYSP